MLIVESSPPAAMLLRTAFEHSGFAVQIVRTASGVRQALERDALLAVVVSMDLPAANEILTEVSAYDPKVPIVAMATAPDSVDAPRASAILKKPVDPRALVEVVDRLVPSAPRGKLRSGKTALPPPVESGDRERLVAGALTHKATLDLLGAILEGIVGKGQIERELERILQSSLEGLGAAHCAIWIGHTADEPAVKVGWPGDEGAVGWRIHAATSTLTGKPMGVELDKGNGETCFFAVAPIPGRNETVGTIAVAKPSEKLYDAEWLDFGRSLGMHLGRALEVHAAVRRAEAAETRALDAVTRSELIGKVRFALATERNLDDALDACVPAMEEAWVASVCVFVPGPSGALEPRGSGRYRVSTGSNEQTLVGVVTDGRAVFSDRSVVQPFLVRDKIAGALAITTARALRQSDKETILGIAKAFAEGIARTRTML